MKLKLVVGLSVHEEVFTHLAVTSAHSVFLPVLGVQHNVTHKHEQPVRLTQRSPVHLLKKTTHSGKRQCYDKDAPVQRSVVVCVAGWRSSLGVEIQPGWRQRRTETWRTLHWSRTRPLTAIIWTHRSQLVTDSAAFALKIQVKQELLSLINVCPLAIRVFELLKRMSA